MFASGLGAFAAMAGLNYLGADNAARKNEEAMKNRHQWEVVDLNAAGLNPILSAGGGGTAGMPGVAPHASPDLTSALSLETDLNKKYAEIDLIKEEVRKVSAEVGLTERQEERIAAEIPNIAATYRKILAETKGIQLDVDAKQIDMDVLTSNKWLAAMDVFQKKLHISIKDITHVFTAWAAITKIPLDKFKVPDLKGVKIPGVPSIQ